MTALPAEVAREIARQVQADTPVDQLEISTAAIRATVSGRQFNPANVAMTYGTTLCLGTRVNFTAGHTEAAALYEAADHAGRIYAVMVPKVCGNVSVLGQLKRKTMTGLSTGAGPDDPELRCMPPVLDGGPQVHTAVAERDRPDRPRARHAGAGAGRTGAAVAPPARTLTAEWAAVGATYFRTGGKSVQLPCATSAAMPMLSPSVGWGWMVLPMSTSSAPISMASATSPIMSPACVPTMPPPRI